MFADRHQLIHRAVEVKFNFANFNLEEYYLAE